MAKASARHILVKTEEQCNNLRRLGTTTFVMPIRQTRRRLG